jgi:hypothetical protein
LTNNKKKRPSQQTHRHRGHTKTEAQPPKQQEDKLTPAHITKTNLHSTEKIDRGSSKHKHNPRQEGSLAPRDTGQSKHHHTQTTRHSSTSTHPAPNNQDHTIELTDNKTKWPSQQTHRHRGHTKTEAQPPKQQEDKLTPAHITKNNLQSTEKN